ncbi:hypothetical protein [Krasilnikovia sp. M28-CT-15]|uniref:hypothetical protein n=1 Tax=Krasilnikovia sp. M28-CT-15 TaxID=3373540 RepID=UPI0038760C22
MFASATLATPSPARAIVATAIPILVPTFRSVTSFAQWRPRSPRTLIDVLIAPLALVADRRPEVVNPTL